MPRAAPLLRYRIGAADAHQGGQHRRHRADLRHAQHDRRRVRPMTAETVTLKIDGQSVTVPKGANLLEAARTVGIVIPYFCYHPGLSSPAVCRQCLVDVKGQPKLVPSCYTPVAENQEVITKSQKVLTARQQMLEFTLVNHPV